MDEMTLSIPLVGRASELVKFGRVLADLQEGHGSVLIVAGDAGIGKSRLIQAAAEDARQRGVAVAVGHCLDSIGRTPFEPWFEVLRSEDADRFKPQSSKFIDENANPQDVAREIVGRVTEWASRGPLMVVIEDVQWAEAEALSVAGDIARRTRHAPILLCVTYRSEEVHRGSEAYHELPKIVRDVRSEWIKLNRLEQDDVYEAVGTIVSPDSLDQKRLVALLGTRAEGNPLYLVELLRGLVEDAVLERTEEGSYALAGQLDEYRVPEQLQQIVESRVARLPAPVKERLVIASVLGDLFDLDALARVCDIAASTVVETVESGIRVGVLDPSDDGRTVRFHHNLIREALYWGTSPLTRRQLHQHIAATLSQEAAPDPDAVAWHYLQAHDERGVYWLQRAAERAQHMYAWTAAAERLQQCLTLLEGTHDAEKGWLYYRIGRLLRHADAEQALSWLQRSRRTARLADDACLEAMCKFDHGHLQIFAGRLEQGLAEMMDAIHDLEGIAPADLPDWTEVKGWIADAVPGGSSDAPGRAGIEPDSLAHLRLGTLVQWLAESGRYSQALEFGLPFLEAIGENPNATAQLLSSAGDAWYGVARAYAASGRAEQALGAFDAAADCYERIDHHLLIAFTRRAQVDEIAIPFRSEDPDFRHELLRKAEVAISNAGGALHESVASNVCALDTLILEGEWPEARQIAEYVSGSESVIDPLREFARTRLSFLEREQGRPEIARELIEDVLPHGYETQAGSCGFANAIYLQVVATNLALDSGDELLARAWLQSLDRWISWGDARFWRPRRSLLWSRLHLLRGDRESAERFAKRALDIASSVGMAIDTAESRLLLAEVSLEDNAVDIGQHLEIADGIARRSRAVLLQLSAQLLQARLRANRGDVDAARDLAESLGERVRSLGASRFEKNLDRVLADIRTMGPRATRPFGLSAREIEVLRLVAQGMTDAEVADRLFISYRTVTTHLTSIFNKLGVNSRVSATRIAVERDLL